MEIATEKLKRYNSPGTDQIPAEFTKAGSEILFTDTQTYLLYME
jgi:hypothetical protein